jgi:hypothetical protein
MSGIPSKLLSVLRGGHQIGKTFDFVLLVTICCLYLATTPGEGGRFVERFQKIYEGWDAFA